MVFEDAVQSEHDDVRCIEVCRYPLRLRQAVRNATRAQHLKGVQYHDAISERVQAQVFARADVEPLGNLERRGGLARFNRASC